MSRSNPTVAIPNPCTRWMKFNGSKGKITYFDKTAEKTVEIDEKFVFILLDSLAMVRGWDEEAETDIFSNEIRNIVSEELVVRRRKGEKVARGLYSAIKDACLAAGAEFHTSLYVAYKDGRELKTGNLRLKGAAVSAWMAFEKKHRAKLYEQAIVFVGTEEHSKGQIKWKTPIFDLMPLSPDSQAAATALDADLQAHLKSVATASKPIEPELPHLRDEDVPVAAMTLEPVTDEIFDDDIPF